MKHVALNDKDITDDLFPFSLIRHVADIRIGILTIREKWEFLLGQPVSLVSDGKPVADHSLTFAANIVPSQAITAALIYDENKHSFADADHCRVIQYPWHIFQFNDWAIRQDFKMITAKRISAGVPETVYVTNPKDIFIEEGARLSHCILNASTGPIYIGKGAEIMEGVVIRGPFALCEGAVVKMGAKIYGATTIGPYSVVGGELKNTVIMGYSNKAHDGYLGDAVLGEWCNLGAGTSNSNLKNNLGEVNVLNPLSGSRINAGIKCGLLMGDYSRSAINTSFNTGTVVGISSNVFGNGLTPAYIPGFSWGYSPLGKYQFEKAITDIANWKKLKGKSLTEDEIAQLKNIFNQS